MGNAKVLVLMKGFPATGKSSLAHALSRRLVCPLIDKDDIKDHTLHFHNGNVLAYEIMWSVTRRQLEMGLSVVVDSPLTYPVAYEAGLALSRHAGAHLLVVETVLDEATWRDRLELRDRSVSAHKVASWADMQAMLKQYDGCWQYAIAPEHHMVADATQPVDSIIEQVLYRIEAMATGVGVTE